MPWRRVERHCEPQQPMTVPTSNAFLPTMAREHPRVGGEPAGRRQRDVVAEGGEGASVGKQSVACELRWCA